MCGFGQSCPTHVHLASPAIVFDEWSPQLATLRSRPRGTMYGCDACETVCPYSVQFAQALPDDSPFAAREALAGKDARTLAREILTMDLDAYRAAFKGSPMKRAKLPAMKRNAAVVLGNVGTSDDADVLARVAAEEPDEMVREHAAWALGMLAERAKGR